MHRTMAVVLLGMSLLIQSHVVTADATPYPAQILGWCSYNQLNNIRYGCGFTSPAQACSAAGSATSLVFDHFDMTDGYAAGRCWYSDSGLPSLPLDTYHRVWTRNTYCYRGGQEEDYTVAAPICSCRGFPPGYVYPPGGPGPGLPLCVPGTCPVPDLNPNYPPADDTCTAALEAGRGNPVPRSACPAAPVMSDPLGEPCLARRLAIIGVPYAGPTATIRTAAYQAHLFDVWNRNVQHQGYKNNPTAWAACAEKRAEVEAEMTHHSITDAPAANGSLHISGNAFDISRATVNSVPSIPHLLRFNQPGDPACNLRWGNTFRPPDRVHFYTPTAP